MAFKKRGTSSEQDKANNRLSGIKQFETTVNYGPGLTEVDYTGKIGQVNTLTHQYNSLLLEADGVSTQLNLAEKDLANLSSRFLNAVGAKYGYDSVEYEKAGGVRTSEIKHSPRKANGTTAAS